MTESEFTDLLTRFEKGHCTPDEKELLEKWLDSPGKGKSPFRDEAEKLKVKNTLRDSVFQDAGIFKKKTRFISFNGTGVSSLSLRATCRIAASIVLLALSLGAVYFFLNPALETPETIDGTNTVSNSAAHAGHQFIKLPDGSTVVLNAGSTLHYPEAFGRTREVTLIGEGFFDIRHDPAKPFIVHTGKLKTTVLGTAFNIRALPGDYNIIVTVARGKVQVQNETKILGVIKTDEQITFNLRELEVEQEEVESRKAVAWMENDVFLDDLTMEKAVARLEERFNTKITIASDGVKSCRFTATFVRGETLDEVMEVICAFNNAAYTKDENGTITITGDGCQ